ncbi:unnamed protein product [Pylaiella littoralis]
MQKQGRHRPLTFAGYAPYLCRVCTRRPLLVVREGTDRASTGLSTLQSICYRVAKWPPVQARRRGNTSVLRGKGRVAGSGQGSPSDERESALVCVRQSPARSGGSKWTSETGVDTTSDVRFPCDSDEGEEEEFSGTPLELATSCFRRFIANMRVHREFVGGLKGVIRLLQQVEAVHAVSWRWPIETGRPTGSKREKKSASIVRMLPLLRKRAAKPQVLLAALSRCVVLLNYSGGCCGQYTNKLPVHRPFVFDRYNKKHDGAFLGYLPEKNAGV